MTRRTLPRRPGTRPARRAGHAALAALAILGALATLGAGCPPRSAPRPPPGRTPGQLPETVLRVRMPSDVPRLPCLLQGHTWCDRILMGTVYEPLVRWDVRREAFVGVLAVAWTREDAGRRFLLTLRKDVRWHDGRPLTAKDVKHSLERLQSAAAEREHPVSRRLWGALEKVTYRTDLEVELHFRKPFGPVPELLSAIPIQPAPAPPGGGGSPGTTVALDEAQVTGTGPYRFVQWWPGEKVVLGRAKTYWGAPASLARVEFLVLPALEAVVDRLRKGTLDLVLDLDTHGYRTLLGRLGKDAHPIALEPAGYTQLVFNCRNAPFNDARVRRALALLIDRKLLVSGLPGPRPILMDGPVWRHGPQQHVVRGTLPPPDPATAARLLREAGYVSRAGRWEKNGQPLVLAVRTAQRSDGINRGLRAVKDALARAGVTLAVEKRLWGELVTDLRRRRFDALLLATPLSGPWTDLAGLLHSQERSRGGNHAGFSDPEVDRLLDRILGDPEPTRRLARERRLLQRLGKDVPFLTLHAPRSLGFSRRALPSWTQTTNWLDINSLRRQ